ncbi:MAG TPA: hypothetical protein VIQ30_01880 [Pseudonocardia sp.]
MERPSASRSSSRSRLTATTRANNDGHPGVERYGRGDRETGDGRESGPRLTLLPGTSSTRPPLRINKEGMVVSSQTN